MRKPGRVTDRIWFLGQEESGVYLLEGNDEAMIVSGGMSYLVPTILRQFEEFGIREEKISKFLILHSHFDHVGILPFFKRRYPQAEVYASSRAWEILRMEKAVATINEFSRTVAKRMGREEAYRLFDLEWRDDVTGQIVREGDEIDLGGMSVSIVEVPGHSSCSIAAYVNERRALFPSDAGGIPFDETIIASGNSNYTKYQESLEKLKDLPVDFYCADHYGYVTGDEAEVFIQRTIEVAKEKRNLMEEVYRSTRDVDLAAKKLVMAFYDQHPSYFLSPEIFLEVYRQMVRHIASVIGAEKD